MQRISTSLSAAGYEVTLIGRKLTHSKPLPDFPFRCVRLPFFFTRGKFFYLEMQIRYFFYLLFHSFDIYGAIDLDTALPNFWVARLKGKKWVYDAHEYFTEVPEIVERPGVQRMWKRIERWTVPHADLAYTVSPGLADLFEKEYHKPFSVIRNVPFRQRLTSLPSKENKIILYQGALNEGRALEFLIPAIKDLDVELWIAGEGDLSKELRQLSSSLELEAKVKFLGYLPPHQLRELTPKAWLGFNVLENKGLSYYYSLANKCFDYLQAGVPTLCSPFPEYLHLAKEYPAFIFAAANTEEIRLEISVLLNKPEAYQQLCEACIPAAENLC
ncbi:MAG: glycosyltransferase, partial [Bacteroidota bacterium]|nr:glycosyltransferase [Bacteroidota bacterium]MDX5431284.1 glycosyltransferase [Bacteroidota bacterium]MDX5470022.1 glycosyltransferase [Bacteroidota bacterium]